MKSVDKIIILDVRDPYEYSNGFIPSSRNTPLNDLLKHVQDFSKHTIFVINCNKGGGHSKVAAELLKANGWKNSYWLEGGYLGYIEHKKISIGGSRA